MCVVCVSLSKRKGLRQFKETPQDTLPCHERFQGQDFYPNPHLWARALSLEGIGRVDRALEARTNVTMRRSIKKNERTSKQAEKGSIHQAWGIRGAPPALSSCRAATAVLIELKRDETTRT